MENHGFISLVGGIFLLLYGFRLMVDCLRESTAERLRKLLRNITNNRLRGFGVGVVVSSVTQSSTVGTVLLVGMVSAGLLSLQRTLGVILGMNVGTTLFVQLIAFRLFDYALHGLMLVAMGTVLFIYGKRSWISLMGKGILGLGFVFFAFKLMWDGSVFVKDNKTFLSFVTICLDHPILLISLSTIIAGAIHNSAAVIGMAMALGGQGIIGLESALLIVLGANIGTCTTAWITSLGAGVEARQVALAHVLFKFFGVLICYPLLHYLVILVSHTASDIPRQIANAHSLFNLGLAVIFLPMTGLMSRLVQFIIPTLLPQTESGTNSLQERYLKTPDVALGMATREVFRMADLVKEMIRDSIRVFVKEETYLLEEIKKKEAQVDRIEQNLRLYLARIPTDNLPDQEISQKFFLINISSDIETIGDIICRNILKLAIKKTSNGYQFSENGFQEIRAFHHQVLKNFEMAISALITNNSKLAKRIRRKRFTFSLQQKWLHRAHIERLERGLPESLESTSIHMDLLENLYQINMAVCRILRPISQRAYRFSANPDYCN